MTPRKQTTRQSKKRGRLVIGLMSGTSADGIDVALVRIVDDESGSSHSAQLENFVTLPFPPAIRAATLRLAEGAPSSCAEISQMNFRLGELFARARFSKPAASFA